MIAIKKNNDNIFSIIIMITTIIIPSSSIQIWWRWWWFNKNINIYVVAIWFSFLQTLGNLCHLHNFCNSLRRFVCERIRPRNDPVCNHHWHVTAIRHPLSNDQFLAGKIMYIFLQEHYDRGRPWQWGKVSFKSIWYHEVSRDFSFSHLLLTWFFFISLFL